MINTNLIGQYLLQNRLVSNDQIQKALQIQANTLQGGGAPLLGTVLVQMGAVKEQDVTQALEQQSRDRGQNRQT